MPVEIVWSPLTRTRLEQMPGAAEGEAEPWLTRMLAVVEALRLDPRLGRPGAAPGLRELVIGGSPCSLLYRVQGKRVMICAIGARVLASEPASWRW